MSVVVSQKLVVEVRHVTRSLTQGICGITYTSIDIAILIFPHAGGIGATAARQIDETNTGL